MRSANAWAVACGLALAAGSVACDRSVMKDSARGHEGAPINLVGCLQKSEKGLDSYVLTQVNSPTQSVGTSGQAKSDAVAREDMREAKHAYRLNGDDDELDRLVGKQVRVEGTIVKSSDLTKRAEEMKKDNTAPDLSAGDLAKVDVKTIAAVSDTCK